MKTNTQAKHTPGLWRIEWKYDHARIMAGQTKVAVISYDPKERQANARLIARAPILKATLAELIDQLEGLGIEDWNGAEGLDLSSARAALEGM